MTDYTSIPANAQQIIRAKSTIREDGCWEWHSSTKRYGQIMVKGTVYAAHRLSFAAFNGPISEGLNVCHTCDFTLCVNPEHLFLGTHKANMEDMAAKDRGPRELRNASGKVTDEQIREIRSMAERGFPVSWIASEYPQLSKAYIRRVINRRVTEQGYVTRGKAG